MRKRLEGQVLEQGMQYWFHYVYSLLIVVWGWERSWVLRRSLRCNAPRKKQSVKNHLPAYQEHCWWDFQSYLKSMQPTSRHISTPTRATFFSCGYPGRENAHCVCLCASMLMGAWNHCEAPKALWQLLFPDTAVLSCLKHTLLSWSCLLVWVFVAWLPSPLQGSSLSPCCVRWGVLSHSLSVGEGGNWYPPDLQKTPKGFVARA